MGDPVRHTPHTLARVAAAATALGHEVGSAAIVRTATAVAYPDRLAGCREPLQRVVRHGREGGALTSAIQALLLLAQDAFHTGRWEKVRQLADEGVELCRTHGYDLLAWSGQLTGALLAAARGDFDAATDTGRDMDAWAAASSTPRSGRPVVSPAGTFAPCVFHDLIEAAIHTGRDKEATAHLTAGRACGFTTGLSPRLWLITPAGARR
ncbi:hypothetical protein [Streptomyces sp. NPDC002276]